MEVMVKVPCTIEVKDYHEFSHIEEILKRLNKKIRVTELGFDKYRGSYSYVGLIHVNTAAHKKLIKELSAILEYEK
jgi:hypothetical protein